MANGISRRRALQLAGMAAAAAMTGREGALAKSDDAAQTRLEIPINDGWKFIRRDVADAQSPGLNDHAWQPVNLPHTYNGIDGETYGHYYRGSAWYRLKMKLPASVARENNKRYYLYFEGAATIAKLYVNGTYIGEHRGNFAGFCFDVTDVFKPGTDNLIAVRVDNAWNRNIPPLSGDFNIFGGLYRTAHLLITNPICISPLDYGSPGAYILQERVSQARADLKLTALVCNASPKAADLRLQWQAVDHAGQVVATQWAHCHAPAGVQTASTAAMQIDHPHLWHGRTDPISVTHAHCIVARAHTGG
jgi:beta-galactosidase